MSVTDKFLDSYQSYLDAHRIVLGAEEELAALRKERTNLSEDDPRGHRKARKRLFSRQTTLVAKICNASQKRNKALVGLEAIMREQAVLESK